ncbi:MAG: hypothetical protein QOC79_2467 [Actinomycetota bacterium]|jgi:hypothetical protein|nr:hypothetical protein [Actinomycetota bacterium]
MSTMPYWMNKTPEMAAMDRWFSDDLVTRYTNAITSINTAKQHRTLPGTSDALDNKLAGTSLGAFAHFGKDWLNPNNPSSGGDYWPHVPTFTIIPWLQTGLLHAAQKGLGEVALKATLGKSQTDVDNLFKPEFEWSKLSRDEVQRVVPLVTTWVCTSPPGTGTIQVDSIRGPSVVELIISTPQPAHMQSRIFEEVRDLIDEQWVTLHGGPSVIDLVDHHEYDTAEA